MYPAKVLLFGEHTILRGGRGLAVPYPARALRWVQATPDERLLKFSAYLRTIFAGEDLLDADQLEDHLSAGWVLAGDIPTGYGLGSSGAVCAACWDYAATEQGRQLSGEALRHALARMEQYFHGSSSGTDPLVAYLNQPVSLRTGAPTKVNLPANWNESFFLVDTGRERQASTLIESFTSRYDHLPDFALRVNEHWTTPADNAITALLTNDRAQLTRNVKQVSDFQRAVLPEFIPAAYHDRWQGPHHYLKLCGAGGGGMLLGYLPDPEKRGSLTETFGAVEWL